MKLRPNASVYDAPFGWKWIVNVAAFDVNCPMQITLLASEFFAKIVYLEGRLGLSDYSTQPLTLEG